MNVFVEKHYAGIKKATYQLLINLAKGLKIISTSIAVIFFADKNNGKKNISQSKPALLFGLPVHCEGLKMALEQANAKFQVAAMVDTSNNLLANKEQLQALISEHGAKAIIFCMDDVSAKEVISAIQNIAPSVDYFFNYAGSGCLVGSRNKNQRGDWIVLN
jgi:hypothetical protein